MKRFLLLFLLPIYFTSNAQIVINEINYKDEIGFESKDWIELYNNGSNAVDISNWVFKDDDDLHEFIIPSGTTMNPGSYLVLVQFLADFQTWHTGVAPILGDFTFGLSGGGELIRLFDSNAVLIDFVQYDDIAPWPTEPDGTGPSLELRNANLDNALASSWAASVLPNGGHGTPGLQNSTFVLGITDFNKFSVSVYPNPMINKSTIQVSGYIDGFSVSIYNLLGQEVNSIQSIDNSVLLEKGTLHSGIYILQIQSLDGKKVHSQKLVIK